MTNNASVWWELRPHNSGLGHPHRIDASHAPHRQPGAAMAIETARNRDLLGKLAVDVDYYLNIDDPLVAWPGSFYTYQLHGIRTLLTRDTLLLADDMGLGKTVQAIAALRIMVRRGTVHNALILAPAGLLPQWRLALRTWAPELRVSTVRGSVAERAWQWKTPAHVTLTSYETVRADFTANPQSPPRRVQWDVVILDEAQKIKNRDTDISRICKQLPRDRSWALTGTPLENSIDDLASICEFLSPWTTGQPVRRFHPDSDLLQHHATVQLRRRKGTVLRDLPPKIITDVHLALTMEQRQAYVDAERRGIMWLKDLGANVRITHILELITRLKQICNFCPRTASSVKLQDLAERVKSVVEQGEKAIVFSQYVDDKFGIGALARAFRDLDPISYTGLMESSERTQAIHRFQQRAGGAVLLLSLRAGGQGLNLQEASYVFHFDRWWNPAVERQAEDRAHRIGQTLPVTVYRYVCEDTIEERIDELLRQKGQLFDQIVDDVSLESGMTTRELYGLFGLN